MIWEDALIIMRAGAGSADDDDFGTANKVMYQDAGIPYTKEPFRSSEWLWNDVDWTTIHTPQDLRHAWREYAEAWRSDLINDLNTLNEGLGYPIIPQEPTS